MSEPLLQVRGLSVRFRTRAGTVTAVDQVDLDLGAQETLALVGESGCGKSVTAQALLGLHPKPPEAEVLGSAKLAGTELVGLAPEGWRKVRGARIAMVFQEPMTALNPVFSIGHQIVEAIRAHAPVTHVEARRQALALLDEVAIPDARRRLDDYPHQLSGGMRQRALIAVAIASRPKVLVADEPTTALDVTIQAQILELLKRLRDERGMALILITHDLGVVADMADRVAVLYAGRKVEEAATAELFARPMHPYTQGLLGTRARPGRVNGKRARLVEIKGTVPALHELPAGCTFAPRCPHAIAACGVGRPSLVAVPAAAHHESLAAAPHPDPLPVSLRSTGRGSTATPSPRSRGEGWGEGQKLAPTAAPHIAACIRVNEPAGTAS